MKLRLLCQNANNDYDTYDSCIVAAKTEDEAKAIHPRSGHEEPVTDKADRFSSWTTLSNVKCEYVGEAKKGTKAGVIIASFSAG